MDAGNRLLEDVAFVYNYDNNGNMISRRSKANGEVTQYVYDAENQLVRVDLPGGDFAEYKYDGLGRRIQKNANGVLTRYVYDDEDIVLEYNGANQLTARYTHGAGIDEPLLMERDVNSDGRLAANERFYYHTDGLGSIVELTSSVGIPVQGYVYKAFGQIAQQPGNLLNPYTYTGRELDPESGLYFYRTRYYDPSVGRFLQEDPIGYEGGLNLYHYVLNNPINWVDPFGLKVKIRSRRIFGGLGAHTWVEIQDDKGRITYSGVNVSSQKLGVKKYYPPDYNPSPENPVASEIEVSPPEGIAQEQWDSVIRSCGDQEQKLDEARKYELLGGDQGKTSGNCHVVTRRIIECGGVQIPKGYDPPGRNPGLR